MPLATAPGEKLPRQGGWKHFFDLIFWLLFYQEKSNSPSAAIERTGIDKAQTGH
jgi:hypothetical protein